MVSSSPSQGTIRQQVSIPMTPIQRFRSRSEVLSIATEECEEDEYTSFREMLPHRFERQVLDRAPIPKENKYKRLSLPRQPSPMPPHHDKFSRKDIAKPGRSKSSSDPPPQTDVGKPTMCKKGRTGEFERAIDKAGTGLQGVSMNGPSDEGVDNTPRSVQFKKVAFVHNYNAGRKPDSMHNIVDGFFKSKPKVRKLTLAEKADLYEKRPDLAPIYPSIRWPTEEELDELGEYVLAPLDATWNMAERGLHKGGEWFQQLSHVDAMAGDILLDCANEYGESVGKEAVLRCKIGSHRREPAAHRSRANSSLFDVELRDEIDCHVDVLPSQERDQDVVGMNVRGLCRVYASSNVGKLLNCNGWE